MLRICRPAVTVESSLCDLRFTNQIAGRAWDYRDKGIWLRPLEHSQLEFRVHDWNPIRLEGEETLGQ